MKYILLFLLTLYLASPALAATYTVDKSGRGSWNELNQISWSRVLPGDTILIQPGTYTSTLTVGNSGLPGQPITIRATGKVYIFGGRSTPLPECGQVSYTYQTAGVRTDGIVLGSSKYVTIDGSVWNGIVIYGHNRNGINLDSSSDHITLRNLEVYDNGNAVFSGSTWYPDQQGVDLAGSYITFERVNIHDNGQDAFQGGGGTTGPQTSNFTLRESWLYNSRPHSTQKIENGSAKSFNECRHSDGIQIYGGGVQSNFLIERSIIGPGFMQGLLLGGITTGQYAEVNNGTVRDSLFIDATNNNFASSGGGSGTPSKNWTLDQVTSVRPTAPFPDDRAPCNYGWDTWWNFHFSTSSSGHTVKNSIIVGGCSVGFPSGTTFSNNCQWGLNNNRDIKGPGGVQADPQFIDRSSNIANNDFGNHNPTNSACGNGRGVQSFQSVNEFLTMVAAPSSPTPTPTPTPIPTPTPLITCNIADINKDGVVNSADLSTLVADFLKAQYFNSRSDINGDGIVDVSDYALFVKNYQVQTGVCQ